MAPDKLTMIGGALTSALELVAGVVTATATTPLAKTIGSSAAIIVAGLEKLIAEHDTAITFGELESLRLKEQWPDAPQTNAPPPVVE